MVNKGIKTFFLTAVFILFSAGIAASYWFCPVIYASFRSLFWPEKVYWIETLCGSYGSITRAQHLVTSRVQRIF